MNEKYQFYVKLLNDLEKITNSEDSDEKVNDIDELRRQICGLTLSKETDNATLFSKKIIEDLSDESVTNELIEISCKLVAELAKNDDCRKALVEMNFFEPINKCFTKLTVNDATRTQIFRAIGNMCYYNDEGRLAYLKSNGLVYLLESCKYCVNFDQSSLSTDELKARNTMITVILGCLHNVTNENETLRKEVYKLNIMSILKQFIPFISNTQGILIHFGSCVENLLDLDEGKEQFKQEKVALNLYEKVDEELVLNLDEHAEDFFNVLSIVNEIEMSKYYMFQTEFLVKLINALELSSTNLNLSRHIGLFIVSLLVKDEKIDEIFEYKNNLLLNKAIDWLINFRVEQFYVTSAVIIANYLRSDENVKKLIEDPREPHVRIINILKSLHLLNNPSLPNINIMHSLLGALRNFCIAVTTRNELLKTNLIETVLPFCSYENLEVKTKALSIIRIMVKNCNSQNGLELIFDLKSLELFEKIANNPQDHPTLTGESSRLSCYLPIAAKSEVNIEKFCKFKFIPIICNQLGSEHPIMLNEALLALNVLVTINYRASHEQLKHSSLNENLTKCLLNEKLPIEMKLNALKLFKLIFEKHDFYTNDQLKEYLNAFNKLKLLADKNDFLKSHVNQLISLLEDTLIE